MIGRLKGTVAAEQPDGVLVIDVHDVGYEVVAPLGTVGRAARDADGRITLLVHTHVREDVFVLYGFPDEHERAAFRLLLSVAGVGPRTAVGILGALPASELTATVARGDVKRLQTVPGIGKKLADRLALELKDKLASGVLAGAAPVPAGSNKGAVSVSASAPRSPTAGPMGQVIDALVRLGFKPVEAERATTDLRERAGEPLDVLVREALRALT